MKKKTPIPPINKSCDFTVCGSPTGKRHKPLLTRKLKVIIIQENVLIPFCDINR